MESYADARLVGVPDGVRIECAVCGVEIATMSLGIDRLFDVQDMMDAADTHTECEGM